MSNHQALTWCTVHVSNEPQVGQRPGVPTTNSLREHGQPSLL